MGRLKINLAKSAGFCFGVNRAIDIALKSAKSGEKVYMLGDIVHNEDVVKLIERSGIKKTRKLGNGCGKALLIRAHGTSLKTLRKAKQLGYDIIDATCPMVKDIHKIARKLEDSGYKMIVIGDKLHDEVLGIIGQLKSKALVIDTHRNLPLARIKKIRKAAIVVQSTQNMENVLRIVAALKKIIPKLKFCNTICRPTRIKQEEVKILPRENDAIVIIGSKTSANTKRLYEISRAINPKTYWVNSKDGLNPRWFKGLNSVGVTAGASTPKSAIVDVVRYLGLLA
ncbi:MAG: 4-hydroxy-3-methylbut-2-enyl diphosphate reductase [Candidatus Omnitrophica bacterium]|nr:4-hydroxy-3-methylbut-2-enyl diphosphate reductase [Candidatus Omnitrophota bacterium]